MRAKLALAACAAALAAVSAVAHGAEGRQPPVESRLLFSSNRTGVFQIYSVRRSGTGRVQLTFGRANAREPSPSPDGRLLLVFRDDAVLLLRPNGAVLRRIPWSTSPRRRAAWTRDSRRVAVGDGRPVEILDVRSGRRVVLPVRGVPVGWSRDGRRLFVNETAGCLGRCALVAVEPGRSGTVLVHDDVVYASVSPTGRRLAYLPARFGATLRIVDAGTLRERGGGFAVGPPPLVWSPDATRLAFVNDVAADPLGALKRGVLVADVVRGVTTFTDDPVPAVVPAFNPDFVPPPAWTPSGDAITYVGVDGVRTRTLAGAVTTTYRTRDGGEVRDLAWSRGPRVRGGRAPQPVQPLSEAVNDELRLRHAPISALAVDGGVAAFVSCNNIGTWRAGGARLEWVAASTCPNAQRFSRSTVTIAAAGVASIAWTGGGNSQTMTAVLSPRGSIAGEQIGDAFSCCTGGPRRGSQLGGLLGSGPLLVFSRSRVDCPELYHPTCALSAGPQEVWRVREGHSDACPAGLDGFRRGPCTLLAASAGPIAPIASDEVHVLLLLEGGSLAVVDGDGALVRTFGFAPGEVRAGEIDDDDVVVAVPGLLLHYSLATGVLRNSWPLPHVSTGGSCGAGIQQQCPVVRLRVEDVGHGLVAYLLDGELHLLRLDDGRNRRLQPATAARFGDAGLFVASAGAAPWPGRLRFVPLEEVRSTLFARPIIPESFEEQLGDRVTKRLKSHEPSGS